MLNRLFLLWITLMSHYRQHKTQAVFLLLGLALGVAMFLSTLLISSAAKDSFRQAQRTVGGEIVAEIKPANGQAYFSEDVYRELRSKGIKQIIPVVEGRVATESGFLQLLGMDVVPLLNQYGQPSRQGVSRPDGPADNRFQQFETALNEAVDDVLGEGVDSPLFRFVFPPYIAFASASYARMHGLTQGQQLTVAGVQLPKLAIVSDDLGFGYAVFCDIRCAQSLLGMENQLTSIRLSQLREDDIPIIQAVLQADSDGGLNSVPPGSDSQQALIAESSQTALLERNDRSLRNPAFTDAFLLNLRGIGFLSLLVGCFIAFNAASFSLNQRLKMVQRLRLSGAGVQEITLALLIEVLLWALLASIVGCLLGWLVSSTLLPMIGLTLNQLFYNDNILGLGSISGAWGSAFMIALLATTTAMARPLWLMAKVKPLARPEQQQVPPYLLIASGFMLLGLFLWVMPVARSQELGLMIAACWFVGGAFLVPALLRAAFGCSSHFRWLKGFAVLHWTFATARIEQQRTSVAMMAYAIGLAASIAVMTMVVSFETVFVDYLDDALSESLYLRLDKDNFSQVEQHVNQQSAVAMSYRYYQQPINIAGERGTVSGMHNHPLRHRSVSLESTADKVWQDFHQHQGVLINQALALNQQLSPGDTLTLEINHTPVTTRVLGVYYSYGALAPAIVMDQQWLLSLWPSLESYRLGVFLNHQVDADAYTQALVSEFALASTEYLRPQQLKDLAYSIFQQTFYATRVLATTILLIATLGIFCTCYTSYLARSRSNALVRVLGVTRSRMISASLWQLSVSTLLASLIAVPLGLLVSFVSIQLVLRYSFGWYFPLVVDWSGVLMIVFIGLTATLIGSLLPLVMAGSKTTIKELA